MQGLLELRAGTCGLCLHFGQRATKHQGKHDGEYGEAFDDPGGCNRESEDLRFTLAGVDRRSTTAALIIAAQ